MKKWMLIVVLALFAGACSNSNNDNKKKEVPATSNQSETKDGNPSYDPNRGEGKFTNVDISTKLDEVKAEAGNKVYTIKCSACHKLTDERLVGPGWHDVTKRQSAEWIMNFATNTDAMLNKDPKALAMLEICLVRMPNQNISDEDARNVYEFMRKNDGVK